MDTAKELLQAALESSPDKSVVSGTISAFFGACYSLQYDDVHNTNTAELVLKLLQSYEEITAMKPDLMALCLASSTLMISECYRGEAKSILQKADEIFSSNNKEDQAVKRMMTADDQYVLERDFGLQVLAETEDCVIVSKPSGMVCYYEENKVIRKAAKDCPSLEDVLLQYLPLSTLNKVGRGFVHRLDRGTSGCVVLAKTNQMHAQLVTQFFLRKAKKSYQALITLKCQVGLPLEGTVELNINGKPAKSLYRLEGFHGENVAKIHVETLQGRKHQVRIHCSKALNAPILLDPRYGGEAIMFKIGKTSILPEMHAKKRFCLHAQALTIPAFDIDVRCLAPKWWQYVIDELEAIISTEL